MFSKRIHSDLALKQMLLSAPRVMEIVSGHTLDISKANTLYFKDDCTSIFPYKATTECFTGPKKG